jgi:hypothetical protein
MLTSRDRLGACANCGEDVILIFQGINGFRYCLGCERTGPDAILTSETATVEFDADDFTQVTQTPWQLLQAAKRD